MAAWKAALAVLLAAASVSFAPMAAAMRLGPPVESWHGAGGGGGGVPQQDDRLVDQQEQCFPWTLGTSIARGTFQYPSERDGSRQTASAGELIPLQCDSIICPNPRVANCYMNASVCAADEWCQLEDQVRLGPWAMGVAGETPSLKDHSCAELQAQGYGELFGLVCGGQASWGPWLAVRGRCVKYRQLDESCNAYYVGGGGDGDTGPQFAVDAATGAPPKRPLLCAPGLACTGAVQPVPHTCVKARPADVCYQGPWWDSSSWCKQRGSGGLPREELEAAAVALILQLPVETHSPFEEAFWTGAEALRARGIIQRILEALWPEQYRGRTRFPLAFPTPEGKPGSKEWNATAAAALHTMHQANKVWSAIHTLLHNAGAPLSRRQIDASRSLAVWLRQHFFCCNCRGFWSSEVLNGVGLPPDTSDAEAHKRWWWRAHNMASEHSAATRGGHPWIYPPYPKNHEFVAAFGQHSELIRCQNPWFLPWEAAEGMWAIRGGA